MPRSLVEGKAWISHVVPRLRPAIVLDVGPGQGTYFDLLRACTPGASWSCVEIFEPYVEMFNLHSKYDKQMGLVGPMRVLSPLLVVIGPGWERRNWLGAKEYMESGGR